MRAVLSMDTPYHRRKRRTCNRSFYEAVDLHNRTPADVPSRPRMGWVVGPLGLDYAMQASETNAIPGILAAALHLNLPRRSPCGRHWFQAASSWVAMQNTPAAVTEQYAAFPAAKQVNLSRSRGRPSGRGRDRLYFANAIAVTNSGRMSFGTFFILSSAFCKSGRITTYLLIIALALA